jgi:hypothetical protein
MEFLLALFILAVVYAIFHNSRIKHYYKPFNPSFSPSDRKPNQFMSAQAKQEYMRTIHWQTLRTQVFERDSYTCQSCGSKHNLNCHHIDYSMLGTEPLHHLVTLCGTCHTALHNELGYNRTTIYYIRKTHA